MVYILNTWAEKLMLFPQQNAMTTWMIFPDHASGNYWLAMCECDGDTIKAEGREREAGFLMASLNH